MKGERVLDLVKVLFSFFIEDVSSRQPALHEKRFAFKVSS